MLAKLRDVLYLVSLASGVFALVALSWAAVGVALGLAYRAFKIVAG